MKTHLIIPDPHSHYKHNNKRADWIGNLIKDVKPDVVIVGGDTADMPSLCSYDKGTKSFVGRTYQKDIEHHADFQQRLWAPTRKSKKKLPRTITLIGNHEHRITRAVSLQPELEDTINLRDLDLERYYDEVVDYSGATPGIIEVDGILYSHYFVSGVMGRPISGEHPAYSLIQKYHQSCTSFHTHTFDFSIKPVGEKKRAQGLVCGWGGDYETDWAGHSQRYWVSGVALKKDVSNGQYDLEWISMDRLRKAYD